MHARVNAPMPETILPKHMKRKLLLTPTKNVPAIIRNREPTPTFFIPKRSAIIPPDIAMNMHGNANKLMSKPA
jgi:hypothetical protein